uniref:Uncharacterized protein n=1 Tax=Plectus sambesii TaxID=2011161 RepID=A0A914W7M4_9BILA
MDKKNFATRLGKPGPKARANQPVGGLIALGQRSETPDPAGRSKPVGVGGFATKRPVQDVLGAGPSAPPAPILKKPRLDFSQGLAAPSASAQPASALNQFSAVPTRRDPVNDELWRDLAVNVSEFNPKDLVGKVGAAEERLKTTKIPKYLCAAFKHLLDRRASGRAEPMLILGLSYLSKKNGAHFQHSAVAEGLCALIRSHTSVVGQPRPNKATDLTQFGISLFQSSFEDSTDWPLTVVKVYIDDSLGDRSWVDRSECSKFVANILTAFDSAVPPEPLLVAAEVPGPPGTVAPPHNSKSPSVERDVEYGELREGADAQVEGERAVRSRFDKNKDEATLWTLTILRDWWSRRVDTAPKAL